MLATPPKSAVESLSFTSLVGRQHRPQRPRVTSAAVPLEAVEKLREGSDRAVTCPNFVVHSHTESSSTTLELFTDSSEEGRACQDGLLQDAGAILGCSPCEG